MSGSIAISSIGLPGITTILPATAASSAANDATLGTASSPISSTVVQLSTPGRLASILATSGDLLGSLLSDNGTGTNGAGTVAQSLVDAFNTIQANSDSLLSALAGSPPAQQAAQLPIDLASLLAANGTTNPANPATLEDIGIRQQTTTVAGTTVTTLTIDQAALNAAITDNPATVQTLLTQASQALVDQASALESGLVSASTAQPALSRPPAQTAADTTTAANTPVPPAATVATAPNAPATTAAPNATSAVAGPATTTFPQAATATVNFQEDPAAKAIKNVVDPYYAAIIAAIHLGDFVYPSPRDQPGALPRDVPAAVVRAARAPQLTYSGENAGGEVPHETVHAA